MSKQVNLKASIVELLEGGLRIGANPDPSNQFTVLIQNEGEEIISEEREPPNFYLKGSLGEKAGALFLKKEDARDCEITTPPNWTCGWDFTDDNSFCLNMFSSDETLFEKGACLKITLKNVISQTPPGEAGLTFSSDFDLSEKTQTLEIKKVAKKADIIYFKSEPGEDVQNLPNDVVTLKWLTYDLENVELTQDEISTPLVFDRTVNGAQIEGTRRVDVSDAKKVFRLKGYPKGISRAVERKLTVSVLRSGWYSIKHAIFEGEPAYPRPKSDAEVKALEDLKKQCSLEPTLLVNAKNQCVYAVFRHIFQGKERAFLFQTRNPFGPWKFVECSVPDEPADIRIPEGSKAGSGRFSFSTSPGVYCDDKLWLIGGGQIDPGIVSNTVWCLDLDPKLDPKQRAWKNWGAAAWSPRMGHAVVEFQGRIWVMGGRDETGEAVNDVWTLDVSTKQWNPLGNAPWKARCLFNPTVFQGEVWLYGGAREPFCSQDGLYGDVWVYDGSSWGERNLTGIITKDSSRKPIASCLQEFNGSLLLFGQFRTIDKRDKSEKVDQLAFELKNPSSKTWSTFPDDGLKNWGGDTTFSCQLVNFGNKMLIAKALRYEAPNTVMKVYVP